MQNLIQLEDDVKGLPDQALQQLAQRPNPQLPQFLVVSEIQRRSDMRKRFEARQQQPQGTVAQQIVAPQQQGIGAMVPPGQQPMPPRMPMQPPMQQPMAPQGMSGGGIVRMAAGRQATFPMDQTPPQSSIIGQRINNPYNIRQYDQGFLGESGEDSGFVSFEDPMYGVRAADRVLTTYGTKRGINTIRGLINRFAPPSENDTRNYVNYISGELGIDPDAEVDLSDPEMRARILSPMAMMESRSEYSPGQITEMIEMANAPRQELRPLVPDVQLPEMNIPMPQQRETRVTTEEVFDAPVQQSGPQSLDELMTATFGDRQTPDVAPQSRQGAVSRLPELEGALPQTMRQPTGSEPGDVIRLAEDTKVDPKGLITTDNQPVGAIVEDALKAQPKDKVRPVATDISASLALLEQSAQAIGDPSTAVTERMRLLTTPQQVPAAQAASDAGDISILGGLITGKRKSSEEMARIQAEKDATTKRMLTAQAARDEKEAVEEKERPRLSRKARRGQPKTGIALPEPPKQTGLRGRNLEAQRRAEERRLAEIRQNPNISQEQQDLAEANIALNTQQGAQPVDDDQKTVQTAQQQADQYIADARKAREEGLITKEDLAKKEALGAALIQLGAGIAKGDFAEGLSKAGVAAQDVREKARDRAVRARYYDSLAESRTGATPQNLRRLQQAVSEQLKEEFPQGRLANEAAYLARQQELLQQLSKDYGIDISALAATPADPTVAAAQSATPATSRYAFD